MEELVRNHKMLEAMEAKKLKLEEREAKQATTDTWKGKNAKLDDQMNLLKRYCEMRDEMGWSNKRI